MSQSLPPAASPDDRRTVSRRYSDRLLQSCFTDSAIGMAFVSIDGRWLQVNQSLCNFLGYSAQEFSQLTFQSITHPDDLASSLAQVNELLDGRRTSYQLEKRYIHKDGKTVWALLSITLLNDEQGNPLHFIAQIQDITPRKTLERELTRQN